jgi:hypothetical protein
MGVVLKFCFISVSAQKAGAYANNPRRPTSLQKLSDPKLEAFMFFIVNAARWAWRKVKSAIIFLFGGSETESAAQEKTDEGTQETSTAREQNDSSSWGRAKTKARHAWLFLKALIDAILFPEEVKIAYSKVKVFFGWVKQSWGSLKFLICHPKILVAKAKAWMSLLWNGASAWFAKGLALVMSPSAIAVAAVVIVALLLFVTTGHRGPWA